MTEIVWDPRPQYVFSQVSAEKFRVIEKRYNEFIEIVGDLNKQPVTVFDPLTPNMLEELALIREASKELQLKKEEDIRKSQEASKEEEEKKEEEEQKEGDAAEVDETTEAEKTDT